MACARRADGHRDGLGQVIEVINLNEASIPSVPLMTACRFRRADVMTLLGTRFERPRVATSQIRKAPLQIECFRKISHSTNASALAS
jgi:hypothetical protein